MSDPVFSPDGKWMWTGSEWIPAPPSTGSAQEKPIFSYSNWEKKNISKEEKYLDIELKYLQNKEGEPISKEEIQEWMDTQYQQWNDEMGWFARKNAELDGRFWKASRLNKTTILWNDFISEIKIQVVDSDYESYSNLIISFYRATSVMGVFKDVLGHQEKIRAFNKKNKNSKERRAHGRSLRGNNNWDGREATSKRYPNDANKSWFFKNITNYWRNLAPPAKSKDSEGDTSVAHSTNSALIVHNESPGKPSWFKRQMMIANMHANGIRVCKKCGFRDDNAMICPVCHGRMIP